MTNRQPIVVLGYPKSGNTWVSRLLGDILNSPVNSTDHNREKNAIADEGFDRPGSFEIKQWHGLLKGAPEGAKYVYVTRDPRDVVLSVRDYWQMSSIDSILFNEKTKPPNPCSPKTGWSAHHTNYFYKADSFITYDILRKRTAFHMKVILAELEIVGYDDRIEDAVKRQSIENRKKMVNNNMPYGSGIQKNMLKMGGRVGAWKKEWKRRHGEAVHEEWWWWMRNLGYEKDEDWWKKLPEE